MNDSEEQKINDLLNTVTRAGSENFKPDKGLFFKGDSDLEEILSKTLTISNRKNEQFIVTVESSEPNKAYVVINSKGGKDKFGRTNYFGSVLEMSNQKANELINNVQNNPSLISKLIKKSNQGEEVKDQEGSEIGIGGNYTMLPQIERNDNPQTYKNKANLSNIQTPSIQTPQSVSDQSIESPNLDNKQEDKDSSKTSPAGGKILIANKGSSISNLKKNAEETKIYESKSETSKGEPKIMSIGNLGMEQIKKLAEKNKLTEEEIKQIEERKQSNARKKTTEEKPEKPQQESTIVPPQPITPNRNQLLKNVESRILERTNSIVNEKRRSQKKQLTKEDEQKLWESEYEKVSLEEWKNFISRRPEQAFKLRSEVKDLNKAFIREGITTSTPQQEIIQVNRSSIPQTAQLISPGESFSGSMPILGNYTGRENDTFDKFKKLYGKSFGERRDREYRAADNKLTIFFNNPQSIKNAYEVEFYKKFSGKFGVPEYLGAVPNGVQLNLPEGKFLSDIISEATKNKKAGTRGYKRAVRKAVGKRNAENILNSLTKYHKKVGFVHGNISEENIFMTNDGKVYFLGQNLNSPSTTKPWEETLALRGAFEENYGFKKLNFNYLKEKEERKAESNLSEFQSGAKKNFVYLSERKGEIYTFKSPSVSIYQDETGAFYADTLESETFGEKVTRIRMRGFSLPQLPDTPQPESTLSKYTPEPIKKGLSRIRESQANKLIKSGFSKAGAAIGNSIIPVVGGIIGKTIGKTVGAFLTDPIGTLKRMSKFIIKAATAIGGIITAFAATMLIELFIGLIIFILFVILTLFIINSGAYIVPPGGYPATAIPSDDCGDQPTDPVPGLVLSNNGQYAFPMAFEPYFGYSCYHWDGVLAVDVFPANSDESDQYAPLVAYTNGTIYMVVENDTLGGRYIILAGDNGLYYYYAHNCVNYVTQGERVSVGQVIARADRTGSARTTPEHVHFAISTSPSFYEGGLICPQEDFELKFNLGRCEPDEFCVFP